METSTAVATSPALKVIQQAFTDFANGNITAIVNACADDVVFGTYSNPYARPSGNYFGKEGVIEFFKQIDESTRMELFEPREFITQGDRVIVLGHQTATIKHTGKRIDQEWCMSFTVRNGKIQHYFDYGDSYQYAQAFQ
ncbi:MAG TPA: nuclear transport factor 2 family protein [Flavisolibacter sp.]|nr:nuclear transport factor 2 family protein [Flavisolibacter sp.]